MSFLASVVAVKLGMLRGVKPVCRRSVECVMWWGSCFARSCDFTLKNFDIRQEARDQEVEVLRQAKAILSGAKFSLFLQKRA